MKITRYLAAIILNIIFIFCTCNPANCQLRTAKPVPHTSKDSVMIDTESNCRIAKTEIPSILKECPEFRFKNYAADPDLTLAGHKGTDFDCEACRDDYFMKYAYFLQLADGGSKYKTRRRKLILIFRTINGIYEGMAGGSPGFGHLHRRIPASAEYCVYVAAIGSANRAYNVSGQKLLYIQSLKQLITDEVNATTDYSVVLPKEKAKFKRELFKYINRLNGLITDYFYLESAKYFQYSNYAYLGMQ